MSRAKRITEREALDFYATPQALADAICDHLASLVSWTFVVEPSAGHGPFVRAARRKFPGAQVIAVDIDPAKELMLREAGAHLVVVRDWRRYTCAASVEGRKLIVGNPPFRDAEPHIRDSLRWMDEGDELAFLLRLNLLGSQARVRLWNETPLAEVVPIVPRPSFTGGGSGATEYALFRWVKGHECSAILSKPLVWRGAALLSLGAAAEGNEGKR